jgi:hypothetical protein
VIGIVVGHKQGLAENRLSVAVRERSKQIRGWTAHRVLHRARVGAEGFDILTQAPELGGPSALNQ